MHGGAETEFVLLPVSFHRTALSRQVAESVRIRRRGGEGEILNSKTEFSRCRIPRLQLEEDKNKEEREKQERIRLEEANKEYDRELRSWEKEHVMEKSRDQKVASGRSQ